MPRLPPPLKSQTSNLGALILIKDEDNFAPSDSDFLAVLSGQAGIALENARLFTEIQEAYEELQVLDHMKSEFINIAAHELRTPLAILMGYVTILEDDLDGVQGKYVANIMRNAMRLRSLINDMLNLQFLESGEASLATDKLNIQNVIRELVQDMSLMIADKSLDVQISIPDDFPPIVTDRQKLDLIIMSLLDNAIKFTPRRGTDNIQRSNQGGPGYHIDQ